MFLPTLNDFLSMLNDFLPTRSVSMSLPSDFQLVFLSKLNVCMFMLHDFLKVYNMAGGREGLHSTETAIQYIYVAHNMRYIAIRVYIIS